MSDIIERLEDVAVWLDGSEYSTTAVDAQAELRRLRDENARLREALDFGNDDIRAATIEECAKVADAECEEDVVFMGEYTDVQRSCRRIAAAIRALADKEGGE